VVVNVSSLAALVPFPSMGNYCATKAAKDAFTKVVGAEHSGG
jgi:short-subunit dehydrogenase